MNQGKRIITHNFAETQKLGFEFAKTLKGGDVVCLHGDLGSGKTTFVQGLAQGLGITQKIISPTFIIIRSYELPLYFLSERSESKDEESLRQAQAKYNFHHVDLYRIDNEKDVEGLGLVELIEDKENIVVIEWPEKIENVLPEKRITLMFTYLDEDKREITYI